MKDALRELRANPLQENIARNAARHFSKAAMLKLVPAGEEPIATRFDPVRGVFHIACTSGQVYEAQAAEMALAAAAAEPLAPSGPSDLPSGPPPAPYHVRKARSAQDERQQRAELEARWQEHWKRKLREAQDANEPTDDADDSDSDGEASERPSTPAERALAKQLDMAEARRDEAVAAGVQGPFCLRLACDQRSIYMLKDVPGSDDPEPYCRECAWDLLTTHGMALLDWNPDE